MFGWYKADKVRILAYADEFVGRQINCAIDVKGNCPVIKGWMVMSSKLDQLSLTIESEASWGRLQLGVAYWATLVALQK